MKLLNLFFVFLFSLIIYSSSAQNSSNTMASLVPDVERPQKTDRTYIFSRAQFKYSLGGDDYLSKWVDRPLFLNSKLDANKTTSEIMGLSSYEEMQKTVLSYGLDGFAFFPQTSKRSKIYEFTKESSMKGFQLLSEFAPGDVAMSKSDMLQMALNTPQSFKINGKVVITSYSADKTNSGKWQNDIDLLRKQYPDKFIFLPSISNFGGKTINYWQKKFHNNSINKEDINSIKDYLRSWARATDGLYFSNVASLQDKNRDFDQDFYQNFIIRIMKSVLAEPEFKNKYFGLSACIGHENATRFGYTLSSDGTKTLRYSLEAALAAKPEIINLPEWDEQNENTSLRPTIYNGLSSMRILRYYTSTNEEKPLTPIPEDNLDLPNLIISYRKILTLGEKLEIELLNVPDAGLKTSYQAKLILKDLSGNTVYTSPLKKFSGTQIQDETIVLPSEDFANYEGLIPGLEFEINNRIIQSGEGFQCIDLRPSWNWDYKWVKQSIRDLLKPSSVDFKLTASPDDPKIRIVSAIINSPEPLAHVEVLDNNDVVYSYSPDDAGHENKDHIMISLNLQSFGEMAKGLNLSGNITLENTQGNWKLSRKISYAPSLKDQILSFSNARSSIWNQRILIAISRNEINKGLLSVQLPGIYNGTIPIKEIIDKNIIGIPGPAGFNLVISRYLRQDKIPPDVNSKLVQFSVPVMPDIATSIYVLQTISVDGRVYRSKPILSSNLPNSTTNITVYSDTKQNPVSIKVNKNKVPDIVYQFSPDHGSVLMTDAGRPFWGILGGYFAQATERGGGSAGDDIPFISMKGYPKNVIKSAPDWVKLGTEYALQFDGKGTFISLPQGVIPRRAAYSIDMDIFPESGAGKQIIIANRSYYVGSIVIYLDNGILKASYTGENASKNNLSSGLSLPINQWSHLKIRYDQQTLFISVNDNEGKSIVIRGPGLYETASVIGGYGTDWFKGKIKSLRVNHGG